jgi:hypothetical protein
MGREDDDVKVDNVICRTPARNAQNLELVKTEILDMVDRAVSVFLYSTRSMRLTIETALRVYFADCTRRPLVS